MPEFFIKHGRLLAKNNSSPEETQISTNQRTEVVREVTRLPWKNLKLNRSVKAYRVGLFFEALALGIFYLVIHWFLGLMSTLDDYNVFLTIRDGVFKLFIMIIMINMIIDIIDWKTRQYFLESSSYIYFNEFLDTKPGKLIIRYGFLFQSTKIYSMAEFVDVGYRQTIFGSAFFYGNITIYHKDGGKTVLTKVANPALFTKIIQQMIDQSNRTSPNSSKDFIVQ